MKMPPPIDDENLPPEENSLPEFDVRGIVGRIKKLELGDYLYAIGAGVMAFRQIRKHRKEHKDDE